MRLNTLSQVAAFFELEIQHELIEARERFKKHFEVRAYRGLITAPESVL